MSRESFIISTTYVHRARGTCASIIAARTHCATGRRPALFDNLFQSFVLAPFFVFLEVLFKLGYRPALHRAINNETGKRIHAFRKAQQGQGQGQDQSQAQ